MTWRQCCEQAIERFAEVNINKISSANTLMDWHKKFRKKDTFPHPNSKIQMNRKYSPPLLEYFPEARELFRF